MKTLVSIYYISCLLPSLIIGVGTALYGSYGYCDKGWEILYYAAAALILSVINTVWGLILLPIVYSDRKRFYRIIVAFPSAGLARFSARHTLQSFVE